MIFRVCRACGTGLSRDDRQPFSSIFFCRCGAAYRALLNPTSVRPPTADAFRESGIHIAIEDRRMVDVSAAPFDRIEVR
jgi:hypothetical protein